MKQKNALDSVMKLLERNGTSLGVYFNLALAILLMMWICDGNISIAFKRLFGNARLLCSDNSSVEYCKNSLISDCRVRVKQHFMGYYSRILVMQYLTIIRLISVIRLRTSLNVEFDTLLSDRMMVKSYLFNITPFYWLCSLQILILELLLSYIVRVCGGNFYWLWLLFG